MQYLRKQERYELAAVYVHLKDKKYAAKSSGYLIWSNRRKESIKNWIHDMNSYRIQNFGYEKERKIERRIGWRKYIGIGTSQYHMQVNV